MGLSIGIVGLPNVGKSTLFSALSGASVLAANYPFATKDPNVGVVAVPDARLQKLSELYKPRKTTPAALEFVDIAGLVRGASKGEGLGNQFLANIREVDAIAHVLRCFADPDVVHVDGAIDPIRDKEVVETELQLKDLESLEKKRERGLKDAKAPGKPGEEAKADLAVYDKLKAALEAGNSARSVPLDDEEKPRARELFLLTSKPVRAGFALLALQSYFTTGEDECRAWVIRKGARAPQAAGVIHTDFERGFIKAEVIRWDELLRFGSEAAAKSKGAMRVAGKDYVVQDGDVMHFLFNV